jgi:hypothetical protein
VTVLTTQVAHDTVFERRRARMELLVSELRERTALVAKGGGENGSTVSSIRARRSSS